MMLEAVIDSSVLIKWLVLEEDSHEADQLAQYYLNGEILLHAPDLLKLEVANILWKKVNRRLIHQDRALELLSELLEMELKYYNHEELLKSALTIALTCQRMVYDSLYLALMKGQRCPFITADERLVNAVRLQFPQAVLLSNWRPETNHQGN